MRHQISSVLSSLIAGCQPFLQRLSHRSGLACLLLSTLLLSGCVQSEVGVKFDGPNGGTIGQRIHLNSQFSQLNHRSAQTWFQSLENRARPLRGKVKRLSNQDFWVEMPFRNSRDLEQTFNQFFQLSTNERSATQSAITPSLPPLDSHFTVRSGNFLLLERTHFSYDLDLRPLEIATITKAAGLSSDSALDLDFSLTTPWGARSLSRTPESLVGQRSGKTLRWHLHPGQENHLEAVFWMPNGLGLATVAVAAIVAVGMYWKKQQPLSNSTTVRP